MGRAVSGVFIKPFALSKNESIDISIGYIDSRDLYVGEGVLMNFDDFDDGYEDDVFGTVF